MQENTPTNVKAIESDDDDARKQRRSFFSEQAS